MKFRVKLKSDEQGGYYAVTLDEPDCSATGATREEVLANIRDEIRYRLEFCPCSWTPDGFVELMVEDE